MKIRSVEAFLLSYPFRDPVKLEYFGGTRQILKRDAMLIRVRSEDGTTGYGPGAASEHWQQRINEEIAPFLYGRVAIEPDALRVQFQKTEPDAELWKIYCCVEVALYDLAGKRKGMPVSEFLGGRVRDRIRVYGSSGMYMPPEGYAREAALAQKLGFPAYKMRPALGPDGDIRSVELMREATGISFEIMVDAHTWWRMGDRSYSLDTVEQVAREMAKFDITWLEEPILPDNHDGYRKLKELDIVPLASGEHEPNEQGFADLLAGCVDYLQMDVVCQGGYSLARRLFAELQSQELRFAFHSWGTSLELAAAAQIGICWPDNVVEWLEYPCYSTAEHQFMYEWPLATDICKTQFEIVNGEMVVPNGPGLGVEVDESVIERYPWIPGPWSFFTLISPNETFAVISDHSVKWTGKA